MPPRLPLKLPAYERDFRGAAAFKPPSSPDRWFKPRRPRLHHARTCREAVHVLRGAEGTRQLARPPRRVKTFAVAASWR
eukprot:364792-Chlamydomonas_euryale.AAC.13